MDRTSAKSPLHFPTVQVVSQGAQVEVQERDFATP